jgi:hypothetical protein
MKPASMMGAKESGRASGATGYLTARGGRSFVVRTLRPFLLPLDRRKSVAIRRYRAVSDLGSVERYTLWSDFV